MKPTNGANDRPADRSVVDFFRNYLQGQVDAAKKGLGRPQPSEVAVHYQGQPTDPRVAWENALAVLPHLVAGPAPSLTVPPEWPDLVWKKDQETAVALAFSLGNFPQMVRDQHPLLDGSDVTTLRTVLAPSAPTPGLVEWARRTRGAQALLAAGLLRLFGQFEDAEAVLGQADVPASLQALRANETAALDWHRGRADEALASWQAQAPRVPVLFNRGMAALFLGKIDDAHGSLTEAVGQLPETSAWHHLGQLYLALAAGRR
jgi:hypothetical protein